KRNAGSADLGVSVQFHGNDLKLDGITIAVRIIPVRQGVEAIVNHGQGIAQVFLAVLSSGQVREVGGDSCIAGGATVFVDASSLDGECQFYVHCNPDALAFI